MAVALERSSDPKGLGVTMGPVNARVALERLESVEFVTLILRLKECVVSLAAEHAISVVHIERIHDLIVVFVVFSATDINSWFRAVVDREPARLGRVDKALVVVIMVVFVRHTVDCSKVVLMCDSDLKVLLVRLDDSIIVYFY